MIKEQIIKAAIVEDITDIRDALRVLINGSAGFSCIHTYDSAEAAIENPPPPDTDVILMDINLPGKSGIECVEILKEKLPHTQFMMCTIYDDDENIFNALSMGATGYLLKRTSPAQILEAMRELRNGGSPMSTEIARKVVASLQKKKLFRHAEILTAREKEILSHLAKGFLYKEIAGVLSISTETVRKHIHNIYGKLQVQTRTEALNKVFARL